MSANNKSKAYRVYTTPQGTGSNPSNSSKNKSAKSAKSNSKSKNNKKVKEKRPGWVKLVMAIEIIAIILCLVTPWYLGKEDRANKKHDMEAAAEFGDQLRKAINDDDGLQKYVDKASKFVQIAKGTNSEYNKAYRIIGYMEANNNTPTYYYVCTSVGDTVMDYIGIQGMRSHIRSIGEEYDFQMLFENGVFMNQWIFAVDEDSKLHVFAGGGCTPETYFIRKNHALNSERNNRVFEIYPEVDKEYKRLSKDDLQGWIH